jgi:hypothetical protein
LIRLLLRLRLLLLLLVASSSHTDQIFSFILRSICSFPLANPTGISRVSRALKLQSQAPSLLNSYSRLNSTLLLAYLKTSSLVLLSHLLVTRQHQNFKYNSSLFGGWL